VKTVIFLIISLALFAGGGVLMGLAPTLTAWQGLVFIAGILSITLAFFIPATFLSKMS
jgi:hypothetical protein